MTAFTKLEEKNNLKETEVLKEKPVAEDKEQKNSRGSMMEATPSISIHHYSLG
jgi:hypothetical protein